MNLTCVNTNILVDGSRPSFRPSEYMSWFWEASATWPGKAGLTCLLYHTGEREVERGMRLQNHPTGGVRPVARCSQMHSAQAVPIPHEGEEEEAFSDFPLAGCQIGRGCGLPHLLYNVTCTNLGSTNRRKAETPTNQGIGRPLQPSRLRARWGPASPA